MNRLCIYPKDIERITGKSERQCRYIIASIKNLHGKQKHQPVTLEEFCSYMGLKPDSIEKYIK